MSVSVVIPAAGSSRRLPGAAAKQFLEHRGKSLLRWAIEPFLGLGRRLERIVVALPVESPEEKRRELGDLGERLSVVAGGKARQDSVLNGLGRLRELEAGGIWLVHDAARPLLPLEDLRRLVSVIEKTGEGALLAVPVKDTLKKADGEGRVAATVDRSGLWQALTPQGAPAKILWEANARALKSGLEFTDDAGILSAAGVPVHLVEGSPENLKITTPGDWALFTRLFRAPEP